ncbi:hypothetical protein GPECTOR_1g161 [Gonium pectorale]|uniref:EF-hand domain-containing protein n=1 Tax=Gonium pectorale TaxID=33097 RepID=A0A150H209_GONPE|nr:hypothetical protein GPECTOR_1g161 [Gonium pectorale]|eukprot:KXZ56187.1 hypothetical protein GPECTOR_1g161 [Gonium pectorale]
MRTLSVKEVMRTIGVDKNKHADVLAILEDLDRNGDGTIDVAELVTLLEGVTRTRRERKYLAYTVIVMFIFGLIMIGTIIGLTYAMLYSLKDTEVKGGIMYVKNSDGAVNDIIRTGSAEFGVENGAIVHRLTASSDTTAATTGGGGAGQNAIASSKDSSAPVLRTADEIGLETLLELKYLLINGTGKAQLGLLVQGVARVPQEGSLYGTVLHIVTVAGTITLDGTIVTFSTTIANIFAEAGFRVSSTRRALLGSYTVLGFFNTVKDLSASGKPADQSEPKLPSGDFVMKLKIFEPCSVPGNPNEDRCIYKSPKPVVSNPHSAAPTRSDASSLSGDPAQSPYAMSPPMPPMGDGGDGGGARESEFADLDGVELYQGARFMTHMETTISYGGSIRVIYDFALYPLWRKIEVLGVSDNTVYQWQENAWPEGSTNEVLTYYCRNYSRSSTGVAGFNASSVLSYTYEGIDAISGDT